MLETAQRANVKFDAVSRVYSSRQKGLEDVVAIERADLRIESGEFVCVLGPSGCGKSTLLNMVAGLDLPTSGTVRFNGELVDGVNTDVGYMPQESKLFPWLTVRGNIEFPLTLRDVPTEQRRQIVDEYIAKVGLAGFDEAYPHQLSGGMQKRASLARTLVYAPSLLLMDEPFGALDSQTRMLMHEEVLNLWTEVKSTVIFVTHDLTEAITLADKIVVMTRRPSTVAEVIDVPLTRPRDVYAIFEQDGFQEIYDELIAIVREEMNVNG